MLAAKIIMLTKFIRQQCVSLRQQKRRGHRLWADMSIKYPWPCSWC